LSIHTTLIYFTHYTQCDALSYHPTCTPVSFLTEGLLLQHTVPNWRNAPCWPFAIYLT